MPIEVKDNSTVRGAGQEFPDNTNLPTFFLVGAPKCGTTSLYHYLDQHPEIYMSPIKEPNYFAGEIRAENLEDSLRGEAEKDLIELRRYLNGSMQEKRFGGLVSEWTDYVRLFRNAKREKALGEASVCYLWSKTAAANIWASVPQAKILMMLRDPAELAFSLYLQSVTEGRTRATFSETIDACLRNRSERFSMHYPFLELGSFYEQVRRFLDVFPRENILILFYENYRREQAAVLARIFEFLGADGSFTPDTSRRYLEPRVPRFIASTYFLKKSGAWKLAQRSTPTRLRSAMSGVVFKDRSTISMNARDRARLVDYYREDIGQLSALLDRDLGAWMI